MSTINDYVKKISPELYLQLKQSVEEGKWRDGKALNDAQRADMLQLIMLYQNSKNENPEHFSISQRGEIYMEKRSVLKGLFSEGDLPPLNLTARDK